jgi:hypothetical protein
LLKNYPHKFRRKMLILHPITDLEASLIEIAITAYETGKPVFLCAGAPK